MVVTMSDATSLELAVCQRRRDAPISTGCTRRGVFDDRRIQHWLGAGLQAMETQLDEHSASGRFCHGDSPTVADTCLVTQGTPAKTFDCSLDPYPRVMRVCETGMVIPAFADAHPATQPDAEQGSATGGALPDQFLRAIVNE